MRASRANLSSTPTAAAAAGCERLVSFMRRLDPSTAAEQMNGLGETSW